jgi:glycosyltransferase involved in cell wall biosynthesis
VSEQDGVTTVEIPFDLRSATGLPLFLARLNRELWRRRADVLHAHNANVLPSCRWAAKRQRARLVYDSHEFWPGLPEARRWSAGWWKQRAERLVEARLIHAADAVITVNDAYARLIAERYGIRAPAVVRNCPPLVPLARNDLLRQRAGVPESARLVLYQGGYYLDTRGLQPLIEAFPLLPGDVHLALVGFGLRGEEEVLRRTAGAAGVADRVHLLPPVPHGQLLALTMGADIGVIPFYDNSPAMHWCTPNKVYEYLVAGLAVASTDLPELRAILAPEGLGDFFDPTDPRSIAATLSRLLGSDLDGVKARSRRAAERYHHWGIEAQRLLAAYRSIGAPKAS